MPAGIGHGGMPIELGSVGAPSDLSAEIKRGDRRLVLVDRRHSGDLDGIRIGFCGFAALGFDGPTLTIDYVDEHGTQLLRERWAQDGINITGNVLACHPDVAIVPGMSLPDLVS